MNNPKRKVTDLLPSEAILISSDAEKVEVNDTVLLSKVRNKLTPIRNMIAMLEDSEFFYHHNTEIHQLIVKELEQSKINISGLTRNPETK